MTDPLTLPPVDLERETEYEFVRDLVEGSNVARRLLLATVDLEHAQPLPKQVEGVLKGHMVRVYKLYDTMIYLVVDRRGEMAPILLRCLADTLVNLLYILQSEDRNETAERFVRSCLAYEKKLLEEVECGRDDPPPPSKQRILSSVHRRFARAAIDPDEVSSSSRHRRFGPDTFSKARRVGLDGLYEFVFSMCSRRVHGQWYDMEISHLNDEGDRYAPRTEYDTPRPQILECGSVLALLAAEAYAEGIGSDAAGRILEWSATVQEWLRLMADRHEEWLAARQGGGHA